MGSSARDSLRRLDIWDDVDTRCIRRAGLVSSLRLKRCPFRPIPCSVSASWHSSHPLSFAEVRATVGSRLPPSRSIARLGRPAADDGRASRGLLARQQISNDVIHDGQPSLIIPRFGCRPPAPLCKSSSHRQQARPQIQGRRGESRVQGPPAAPCRTAHHPGPESKHSAIQVPGLVGRAVRAAPPSKSPSQQNQAS